VITTYPLAFFQLRWQRHLSINLPKCRGSTTNSWVSKKIIRPLSSICTMPFFSRRLQSVVGFKPDNFKLLVLSPQWIQIYFLPNAFKYFLPYWLVRSLPWSSGYSDVVHQSPTHWRLFRDRHLPRGSMACIHGAIPGRAHTHAATQPGNMLQLQFAENYGDYEFQWLKQYGPMYRVKGCFGVVNQSFVHRNLGVIVW
jgi:hypothetical protein